jgi:hypothetical protein
MKKYIFLSLALAIVILFACSKNNIQTKTYQNQKYGFQLNYPYNWKIDNNAGDVSVFTVSSDISEGPSDVAIEARDYFPDISFEKNTDILFSQERDKGKNYVEKSISFIEISGIKTRFFDFEIDILGNPMRIRLYILLKGNTIFTIKCISPKDKYSDVEDSIDLIINSISFK